MKKIVLCTLIGIGAGMLIWFIRAIGAGIGHGLATSDLRIFSALSNSQYTYDMLLQVVSCGFIGLVVGLVLSFRSSIGHFKEKRNSVAVESTVVKVDILRRHDTMIEIEYDVEYAYQGTKYKKTYFKKLNTKKQRVPEKGNKINLFVNKLTPSLVIDK